MTFSQGRVLGNKIPGYVRQFLAVPFSASTDGANKWLPPQPRAPWDYVLDCSNWGAGCTQPHHNPDVPKNQSLDCLNVNIFGEFLGCAPASAPPKNWRPLTPRPKPENAARTPTYNSARRAAAVRVPARPAAKSRPAAPANAQHPPPLRT